MNVIQIETCGVQLGYLELLHMKGINALTFYQVIKISVIGVGPRAYLGILKMWS